MNSLICQEEEIMVLLYFYSLGSAFLVKNNIDGNSYVAKKMMLEGMAEK